MKKRIFLLATMIPLLAISVLGQSGKKAYKAGTEFVDNLKYEDGVAQFTSAIGLEPSNADYYSARANAYEMLKKYNEAYSDYEKALVFKPKDVDAITSLGRVCNKLGKYNEALALLNHASGLALRSSKVYREKVQALIGLEMYLDALKASDTAIMIKPEPIDYYWKGVIYVALNKNQLAKDQLEKSISKDKKLVEPRLELAKILISEGDTRGALEQINIVLATDDKNVDAYLARSEIFKKNLDFPNAINDVSKTILIDPANPQYYLIRGKDYQEFNQHANAINDFSKAISLKSDDPVIYFARAESYKQIMDVEKAMEDYNKITVLSEDDPVARKLLRQAKLELYKLNQEYVAPDINILNPAVTENVIPVRGTSKSITISGKITEKSALDTLLINNQKVAFSPKRNGAYEFTANVEVPAEAEKVTILARDEYHNEKVLELKVKRTEINPPRIFITAPYTNEGQVFLDDIKPDQLIEGRVEDESQIKSIQIGGVTTIIPRADQLNPTFNTKLTISNINKFSVIAEDIYGNIDTAEFLLNRQNALLAANNPMGKTWVVFIENSSYEKFASLDGPIRDVSSIRRALANYQINNIIHEKDMTKERMERFFNIELRDQLKANQVKSLLIWYAGHGKFINGVGYWIPVNAERDEEFTYFNINSLKAGLQGYADLVHTLVVSDACETGQGFYTAMRSAADAPTCDDQIVAGKKSAQVFASAGYELAVDKSKFTETFANILTSNLKTGNACIPIETIVKEVTKEVTTETGQKPKFGKIQGVEEMGGTFFFIVK